MGSNCCINTGVRGVAFFKVNCTCRNDIGSKNLLNRPIYAEKKNTYILDRILHFNLIFADSNES